jgi:hypothetical protein
METDVSINAADTLNSFFPRTWSKSICHGLCSLLQSMHGEDFNVYAILFLLVRCCLLYSSCLCLFAGYRALAYAFVHSRHRDVAFPYLRDRSSGFFGREHPEQVTVTGITRR